MPFPGFPFNANLGQGASLGIGGGTSSVGGSDDVRSGGTFGPINIGGFKSGSQGSLPSWVLPAVIIAGTLFLVMRK